MRVLGIDLGTTALKAMVGDGGTRVIAAASVAIATSRPKPTWSEQNPDHWWQALVKAAGMIARSRPRDWAAVSAISFSGQMHGAVLLRGGKALRPCILWNDGRAVDEARQLNNLSECFADLAGVRAMAGFAAPKLLWLKAHEPETLAAADTLLAPKDYLRFVLTGAAATDPVDASGLWLLDVAKRQWSPDLAAAAGLRPAQLPPLREANEPAGTLTAKAAAALGLKKGIAVITGTGDAAANTLGLGLIHEGDGVLSLGTAAQIFVTKNRHVPAPQQNIHAFAHALPQRWFQMAALMNGASPLAWIAQRLGRNDIPALLRAVEKRMPARSRLLFLPYLVGERTPHDDPGMRAVFHGLEQTSDDIDLTRAVLEGVALSLADCHDILVRTGTLPKVLFAVGGGFRSRFWARMIASAMGRELQLISAGDYGGALGAARLARAGLTGEAAEAIFTKPEKFETVEPVAAWQAFYAERLPQFRQLYQALKPIR